MALSLHKSCPENAQSQVTAGWERGEPCRQGTRFFFFFLKGGIKSKKDRRRGRRGLGGKEKNQKSYVAPCPHHNLCIHTHWLDNIVFICVLVRTGPYELVNDRQQQKTLMVYLKNCKFTFTSYVI